MPQFHTTAPEAPPTDVTAQAIDTTSIRVSWQPPPVALTNGIITGYFIKYFQVSNPSTVFRMRFSTVLEVDLRLDGPDLEYNISVSAETIAEGPFSVGVIQRTYPEPPMLPDDPPSVEGGGISQTSIPVQLPGIDTSDYRCVGEREGEEMEKEREGKGEGENEREGEEGEGEGKREREREREGERERRN